MLKDGRALQPGAPEAAHPCRFCQNLKDTLTKPGPSVELGKLSILLGRPCPGHDALLSSLSTFARKYLAPKGDVNVVIHSVSGAGGRISCGPLDGTGPGHDLLLACPSPEIEKPGLGRILDGNWVDIGLLRTWTRECLAIHGQECINPLKLRQTRPAWLIDTVGGCLVPGDGIHDYVALSYRWGNTTNLQTEKGSLFALQQQGALSSPRFTDLVSPVIRHASKLIIALGERYLWADALCIVQNDEKQTAQQLQLMGAIYASAKFTIVVADGDASTGIPGLRGISKPREFQQHILPLGRDNKVIIRQKPVLQNFSEHTPYFNRAWTFQEFFLSKRRLVLGNKQFHWICSCKAYHEDLHGADVRSHESSLHFTTPKILSGQPSFVELDSLLGEYNSRDLTFPEDALAGASGLLSILSRSFEGGFLYGLPEMCFDSALLWRERLHYMDTTRRVHSGNNHSILRDAKLPSWSWLGWKPQGMLIVDENTGELFHPGPITTRITQWFSQETPFSSIKRAIHSSFLYHNADSKKFTTEAHLTHGWLQESFNPQENRTPRKPWQGALAVLEHCYYRNPKIPGKRFWRPIPLMDINEESQVHMPPQHAFLSCKTRRGWFQARKKTPKANEWSFAQLQVLDKDGSCCGYLQVHSDKLVDKFPEMDSNESSTVEVVAICLRRSFVKGIFKYYSIVENEEFEEDYGVLWVEWVEGVAYRRASGHIRKDNWESHDLEDVNLILG